MTDLLSDIATLTRRIALLTRTVESAGTVDLAGLDARVHDICEAILAKPEDEARAMREPVEDLLRSIDVLRLALIEAAGRVDVAGADAPPGP
jgi:hypothetical protein